MDLKLEGSVLFLMHWHIGRMVDVYTLTDLCIYPFIRPSIFYFFVRCQVAGCWVGAIVGPQWTSKTNNHCTGRARGDSNRQPSYWEANPGFNVTVGQKQTNKTNKKTYVHDVIEIKTKKINNFPAKYCWEMHSSYSYTFTAGLNPCWFWLYLYLKLKIIPSFGRTHHTSNFWVIFNLFWLHEC